jgi:chromobox protein 1
LHRETAAVAVSDYFEENGGREKLAEEWEEEKQAIADKKNKKRGRASESGTNGSSKKAKKNGHPAASSPPASAKKAEFKVPTGNWEEEVINIDACEGEEGSVVVYLTWKGGKKTSHPLSQVYKRCPQKLSQGVVYTVDFTNIYTYRC